MAMPPAGVNGLALPAALASQRGAAAHGRADTWWKTGYHPIDGIGRLPPVVNRPDVPRRNFGDASCVVDDGPAEEKLGRRDLPMAPTWG